MKKNGFTLAEVLVTLGIIGVIAALTMPTFVAKTSTAKIGPQLAKAVANYEAAAKMILKDADTDYLNAAKICDYGSTTCTGNDRSLDLTAQNTRNFVTELERHMSGQGDRGGKVFTAADGTSYTFPISSWKSADASDSIYPKEAILTTDANSFLMIDLNGVDTAPNRDGRDQFYFTMWNDGSLRAKGSEGWDGTQTTALWTLKCEAGKVPTDATYCAGHIFENGLKVLYK